MKNIIFLTRLHLPIALKFTAFFVIAFLCSATLGFADAVPDTPLKLLTPKFQNLPFYLHNVSYGLTGIAALGAGTMGLFGKMSWPWVGSIVGSTALVGGAYDYIGYIVK